MLAALAAAGLFGGYRALTSGRFYSGSRTRSSARPRNGQERVQLSLLEGTPWVDQTGERATLLQFSSAFCAPCRATRQTLGAVAERTPGVTHVEVDAEQYLDVVRRLGVLRTPTTIVLDRNGHEVTRAAGAPTRGQVEAALAGILESKM